MTAKKHFWTVIGLQALASLLMLSPFLWLDSATFAGNTDALFYTGILKMVTTHMLAGDFYPRWLPEANSTTGSPVMLFYNPLAYQITALITAPFASLDPLGWKRLVIGMFAAQWVGGIAAYYWLRKLVTERSALWASLLFTVFPYKFIYIFLHINLAQLWALVWLPLLMSAAIDITKGKPRAIAWYGLWLGLIALTHARTAVAFGGLPLLYALYFSAHRWRTLGWLAIAHLLAAGLAACYFLPAMMNLNLVSPGAMNMGRMDYASNLSHSDLLRNFHYAIIAALSAGLLFRLPKLRAERGKEVWFYIGALIVITLLCLRISKPLWDMLMPLQFLQFPVARLHAPTLIAATALSALFFDHAREVLNTRWLYSSASLFLPVAVTAAMTLHYVDHVYAEPTGITWDYVEAMRKLEPVMPPEYLTRWEPENGFTPEEMKAIGQSPMTKMIDGMGQTVSIYEMPRTLHITALVASDLATYRVHQLYLPQWTVDGADAVHYDEQGFIKLFLAHGEHKLTLVLGRFAGEIAGNIISLVSLALTLIMLCCCKRKPASLPLPV